MPNRVEQGKSGYWIFYVTGKNSNAVQPGWRCSIHGGLYRDLHAVFDKTFSCVIDEWIAKRSGKFKSHDGFLGQSKPGPKTAAG
jgi:hypothetical protein